MTQDSRLLDLERQALQFSYEEQLWLIERLVQHLRAMPSASSTPTDSALAEMAAGPEIQRELRAIERDFAGAEQDGLEDA